MGSTSWGTRKVLGRRYGTDPALLMEAKRLEEEYGLMPGRESRALQAAQFQQSLAQQDKALAQNQSQFDTTQAGNKQAGMVGTAANLATTGAMIRGLTKAPNEPFFGQTATNYYDKVMGNTSSQPVAGSTTQSNAGTAKGLAAGTVSQYTGAPAPVMDTLSGGGVTFGNYTPGMGYSVNPAMMPEAASGVGFGSPSTAGTASEAGLFGTVAPYAAPAIAGYMGPKLLESAIPGSNENLGHNLSLGLIKGEKDATNFGRAAAGAAAGAAIGAIGGPVGAVAGGVIGAVTGFISSVFGW
jgi:hypothetical protein